MEGRGGKYSSPLMRDDRREWGNADARGDRGGGGVGDRGGRSGGGVGGGYGDDRDSPESLDYSEERGGAFAVSTQGLEGGGTPRGVYILP